jgi:class 3 adenylate cyclase/TolB-like protein
MAEVAQSNPAVRSPDRRKLIAVVYADMVGYSRLIGLDDLGTLARLKALRANLIDPAIEEHGGRIVQTGGDSLLIVFDSIDGAVRCAVKVQQQVPVLDGDQPPDRAIRFRVGINIGDAIADGTDLHGDAVNVVARLQAECPPGDVCVSRAVRDHVHDQLDLTFEPLGLLNLKNIARPVEAFLLRPGGSAQPMPVPQFAEFSGHPAIAVLPFRRFGSTEESFADGLTEELINALSRWRSFPLIARNSVFAYRDRNLDVRIVGRDLGARYIVGGSVWQHGDQVRVSLSLVDAETADNLLSDSFEHAVSDPLLMQDDLVRAIAGILAPEVLKLERERAVQRPSNAANIYDLYIRGMWHRYRNTREDLAQASALFQQVLEINPGHAAARAALSLCLNYAAISRWVSDVRAAYAESLVLARRAVTDDPRDPHAHFALGVAYMNDPRFPEAIIELREAIRLNPSHVFAIANLGQIFNYLNRPQDALVQVKLALRLNPHDPRRFMWLPYLAVSHYLMGCYRECLAVCEQALAANPEYPLAVRYVVAALGKLGLAEQAQPLLPVLRKIDKAFDGSESVCRRLFVKEAADHLLDGLRRAGWT